jgi:hypothetical protein
VNYLKLPVLQLSEVIILGIAAWRASHIVVFEAGPFDIFVWFRSKFGIEHDESGEPIVWNKRVVFGCVWCLSIWMSAVLYFLPPVVSYIFAGSAIAVVLEEYLNGKSGS